MNHLSSQCIKFLLKASITKLHFNCLPRIRVPSVHVQDVCQPLTSIFIDVIRKYVLCLEHLDCNAEWNAELRGEAAENKQRLITTHRLSNACQPILS